MSLITLRYRGPVTGLREAEREALFDRSSPDDDLVRDTVGAIIDLVRREGDPALRSLAREYDHVKLESLEVPRADCTRALERMVPELRASMERAAHNITTVHAAMRPTAMEVESEPGIVIGRRPDPLGRVGVYAPGGKAAYPSSVLMGAIPARVAGVGEVIVCSPPGSTGQPPTAVLAACAIAGVDRVFAVGGAGAVAAMAYGTASIPRVDRIVGPGNAYVAAAKLMVAGAVAIDSPAGPSELLVLADDSADPAAVARELVAQAEHDEQACAVALVLGDALADRVEASVLAQAAATKRGDIVRKALEGQGGILVATSREQATAFATLYAPEHLLIAMRNPSEITRAVRNAGTVFEGPSSSAAFGDYMTGANHVLPTAGLARAYSGLSTLDFVRWTTWQRITPSAAARLAEAVGVFADAEGLDGHARAARAWHGAGQ
ncbi:MAG: histidinol dehydrogenase [Gemmatimonadaceae bacterium]|nr:histidinol dehydrogenase [Gemmatimonadaceae bacterium]